MISREEIIHDTLLQLERVKKNKWIEEFNSLDVRNKRLLVKQLYSDYTLALEMGMGEEDTEVNIVAIGSLRIKKSRKQFVDLTRKQGVSIEEAVQIVKRDFKTLNNIKSGKT
jgi:hypothetical protein